MLAFSCHFEKTVQNVSMRSSASDLLLSSFAHSNNAFSEANHVTTHQQKALHLSKMLLLSCLLADTLCGMKRQICGLLIL